MSVLPPEVYAAFSQAAASLGHAVECLDEANVNGALRDDTALLAERYARLLATPTPASTRTDSPTTTEDR